MTIKVKLLYKLYKELKINFKFLIKRSTKYINKKRLAKLTLKKRDFIFLLKKNIKIKRLSLKLNYIKLKLFKIKEKKELVIFILNLLKNI